MMENHSLKLSKHLLQSISQRIGTVMADKEMKWNYHIPEEAGSVSSVGISRDGTTAPIKNEGYKETMVGTIALYDNEGKRLHTVYTGCSPEHGKGVFNEVFDREILAIKEKYPKASYVAVADGSKDNWTFLDRYANNRIIDFWHVTEYLGGYAKTVYGQGKKKDDWLTGKCSILKNEKGGAAMILEEMKKYAEVHSIVDKENPIVAAITYFKNNQSKMNYPENLLKHLPIGSGVVEAGCKVLVKQRFGKSGCKWTRNTLDNLLMSRALILTEGRWEQFWEKVSRYGY